MRFTKFWKWLLKSYDFNDSFMFFSIALFLTLEANFAHNRRGIFL